jgi:hypothetical protein
MGVVMAVFALFYDCARSALTRPTPQHHLKFAQRFDLLRFS